MRGSALSIELADTLMNSRRIKEKSISNQPESDSSKSAYLITDIDENLFFSGTPHNKFEKHKDKSILRVSLPEYQPNISLPPLALGKSISCNFQKKSIEILLKREKDSDLLAPKPLAHTNFTKHTNIAEVQAQATAHRNHRRQKTGIMYTNELWDDKTYSQVLKRTGVKEGLRRITKTLPRLKFKTELASAQIEELYQISLTNAEPNNEESQSNHKRFSSVELMDHEMVSNQTKLGNDDSIATRTDNLSPELPILSHRRDLNENFIHSLEENTLPRRQEMRNKPILSEIPIQEIEDIATKIKNCWTLKGSQTSRQSCPIKQEETIDSPSKFSVKEYSASPPKTTRNSNQSYLRRMNSDSRPLQFFNQSIIEETSLQKAKVITSLNKIMVDCKDLKDNDLHKKILEARGQLQSYREFNLRQTLENTLKDEASQLCKIAIRNKMKSLTYNVPNQKPDLFFSRI